jgi:hypothetical protein
MFEPRSIVVLVVRFLNASIDKLAFELGTEQYHKGKAFRL